MVTLNKALLGADVSVSFASKPPSAAVGVIWKSPVTNVPAVRFTVTMSPSTSVKVAVLLSAESTRLGVAVVIVGVVEPSSRMVKSNAGFSVPAPVRVGAAKNASWFNVAPLSALNANVRVPTFAFPICSATTPNISPVSLVVPNACPFTVKLPMLAEMFTLSRTPPEYFASSAVPMTLSGPTFTPAVAELASQSPPTVMLPMDASAFKLPAPPARKFAFSTLPLMVTDLIATSVPFVGAVG